MKKMFKVFEAVLVRKDGDDYEVEECKTLAQARKVIKKMINGKPYHDAYIRRFVYEDEEMTQCWSVEDCPIE